MPQPDMPSDVEEFYKWLVLHKPKNISHWVETHPWFFDFRDINYKGKFSMFLLEIFDDAQLTHLDEFTLVLRGLWRVFNVLIFLFCHVKAFFRWTSLNNFLPVFCKQEILWNFAQGNRRENCPSDAKTSTLAELSESKNYRINQITQNEHLRWF